MGFCGPDIKKIKGWFNKLIIFLLNFLLDLLSPYFIQASCKKHDDGYGKGGDEKRRIKCDLRFYFFILRDIEIQINNVFLKNYYQFLAFIFYKAVRTYGHKYFNYIDYTTIVKE